MAVEIITADALDALPRLAAEDQPCVQHDFRGWRNFEDGSGGEAVCSKCGVGAMQYTLRNDPTWV